MKSLISKSILLGAAAAIVCVAFTANVASADRNPSNHLASNEKQVEEYVLGNLRIEGSATRVTGLTTTNPDAGGDVRAATNLKGTTNPANGHSDIDDFKAGPGCSIQCITKGVAYARGPNALLVVETDTPARIWIHVKDFSYDRIISSGTDPVTHFEAYFDDLNDGNSYEASVIARDEEGYESEASGSFMTLYRNVTISYSQANLIERAFGSDADFKVGVWLNGEWQDDLFSYNLPAEGYTLGLGIQSIELDWVNQYLDFAIQLWEAPDYCNNLGSADQPYFGDGSCSFLSFAALLEGENDLDARPAGATSWTEWTLNRTLVRPAALWPSYPDQLLFEVAVTLHVTYTPDI